MVLRYGDFRREGYETHAKFGKVEIQAHEYRQAAQFPHYRGDYHAKRRRFRIVIVILCLFLCFRVQIVLFLFVLCLSCMIGSVLWEYKTGWNFQTYLPWDSLVPSERVAGAVTIGTLVFFSYAIVLNTLVPISLYVRLVTITYTYIYICVYLG